jgi:drug/metabolite transporter (DMT)-like permease
MKEQSKAYIALLMGAVLIAFSPVLIRMAGVPGIVSSFYRLAIGSLTLTPLFLLNLKKERKNISKKGVWIAIAAALSFSIDMAFWAEGIMATNATIPTLAGNLAPLWVGIMAMFIFKERNKAGFWFGLLFALLGVSLLVIQDLYFANGMIKGLILGLLAGVFYAGFIILTQPGRKHLSALSFLYVSTLASTFFLGIILLAEGQSFTGYETKAWVLFAVMGVIIQAGAWFLINFAQGYLPASLVSPTLLAQPVLAGVFAYILLGEMLSFWQIFGGLMVVAGIYTVHFSRSRKQK